MPFENSNPNQRLYEAIDAHFSLEDLKNLCLALDVEYENLPGGDTRLGKARELVQALEKRGRVAELLTRLQSLRENVQWDTFQPAEPEAESPFKGLQHFDETDAHLFFGREQLTGELVEHLCQHRFLAVVGASGSGKSSVVRAGVVPAVRRGEVALNEQPSHTWPIHVITPGDQPLKTLAASLTRENESVTAGITLEADLRQNGRSLDFFISRQMNGKGNHRLLLVVDQFEELFTQSDDPEERRLFVENLVNAVQSGKQGWLSLILTLRADFYAYAVQYEALRPLLQTRQIIVGAMSQEELHQAIVKPAEQGKWQFQPGLVETMLQDVGREPGALPLLSHALQETWERREGRVMTLAGYQAAGGVRKAIATTADAVYASLSESQQAIARNIFLRLTELGEGTEDTRRRAALEELLPQGQSLPEVQTVLDLLTRKRLVTLNEERQQGDAAQNYAEVAHEALIREWPALRAWLDENREGLRVQRQLTEVAEAWQKEEDPSYLYWGGRLAQAREWTAQHGEQLNELEHRFLAASLMAAEQEEQEREAQRQRELEQARQLAEAQRRELETAQQLVKEQETKQQQKVEAAQQLANAQTRRVQAIRQALGVILVLLALAIGAAIFGFGQRNSALNSEATAVAERSTAQAESTRADQNLVTAIAAQQTTEAEGNARATQEAIAVENANQAATSEAQAVNAQTTAQYNANLAATREAEAVVQAQIAQSQALASASLAVQAEVPMRGLLLAIAAGQEAETALAYDALRGSIPRNAPLIHTFQHNGLVSDVMWNGAESQVLTWSDDNTARVWDAATGEELTRFTHESRVLGAVWNGVESQVLTWSDDNTARVWDAATGEELTRFAHKDGVGGAIWNGAESQVLTWGDDTVRVWDAATGAELTRFIHEDSVWGAVWNGAESQVLTWSYDGTVRVWDVTTGAELTRFTHESWVWGAAWNGAESQVLTWSYDGTARVWDVTTGAELTRFIHEDSVEGAVWNGMESQVLTWSEDDTVRVWDPTTGAELIRFTHEDSVEGAVWNGTGSQVLTWSDDGTVWRLDVTTGAKLPRLTHESVVNGATWNGAESHALTWSEDDTARVWDVATGAELTRFIHEDWVKGAVWNGAESQVLTWSWDGTARVWDAATEEELTRFTHESVVIGAAWNGAESQVLTWGDETVRVWDVTTGEELTHFTHESGVRGAAWNGAGSQVLTWNSDSTARVWDVTTGAELIRFRHEDEVWGAVWNEAESQVLTWSADGTARVWDVTTGAELTRFTHESWVWGAAWNGAESQVLTWSYDGTARVWDVASGAELTHFPHGGSVRGAAWNGAESQVLTWSADGTARVWDAATGTLLFTLTGDGTFVVMAQWSQDERQVFLVTSGGFAGSFYTQMTDLLDVACQRTTRNFTWQEWQLYFPGQPYRVICPQWPVHSSVPEGSGG